jgi:hypothetical protein
MAIYLTRDVLETAVGELLGGDIRFDLDRLYHLITLTQHATDLLLNEIERRGELDFVDGMPIVPYLSNHLVETVLTREEG